VASVFFYISGHGFGHASRQIEVINAFGGLGTGVRIGVRTSAASWLFDRTARVPFTSIPGPVDTGVVQIDSLRLDADATIHRANEFHSQLIEKAAEEAAILREHGARAVIADAPALGCAAAAAAGLPSVVCSNFTWDWIYQAYDPPADLILRIQEAYGKAAAAWRLPMHGGFETFKQITDVPFIARHATHARDDVRRRLSLPLTVPLALSSFGGYGVRDLDIATLDCLDVVGVVLTGRGDAVPPRVRGVSFVDEARLYDSGLRYEDLVAAVDVVVTKPGYGIIAECIANGTAMLYTSRGRFAEYDVMVREMPRYLRCQYLPLEDLLAGRWRDGLEQLLAQGPPPERVATDGAKIVAQMIESLIPYP
jgi:L-arabinokinase